MSDDKKTPEKEELEYYADGSISSKDTPVPKWILFIALTLPLWGIYAFYVYWDGSAGWLDRGYWKELQEAANTTYTYYNVDNK